MNEKSIPHNDISYERIEQEIADIRSSMKATCKKFESRVNELEGKLNELKSK